MYETERRVLVSDYLVFTGVKTLNQSELGTYYELVAATTAGRCMKTRVLYGRHEDVEGLQQKALSFSSSRARIEPKSGTPVRSIASRTSWFQRRETIASP